MLGQYMGAWKLKHDVTELPMNLLDERSCSLLFGAKINHDINSAKWV